MSSTNLNADAAKRPIELGQQAPKNITNNCTCNDFDLSDKSFSSLFRNIKPCNHVNFNSSSNQINKNKLFFIASKHTLSTKKL